MFLLYNFSFLLLNFALSGVRTHTPKHTPNALAYKALAPIFADSGLFNAAKLANKFLITKCFNVFHPIFFDVIFLSYFCKRVPAATAAQRYAPASFLQPGISSTILHHHIPTMKKFLISAVAFLLCGAAASAEVQWLRNTSISPDGNTIAFTARGHIYTVGAEGGMAHQLTSAASYDSNPFFSPDGSRIAFTGTRNGSQDVFVIPATGGTPVRLTTHSGSEVVLGWLNDSTILFRAGIMPSQTDLAAPFFNQLYTVSTTPGKRPQLYESLAVNSLAVNPDGAIIFENRKSYENVWRKHEKSAGTPDIYMLKDGEYTRLTNTLSAARTPVWLGDGRFAYCNDEDGALNVYSMAVGDSVAVKLTDFSRHPVRSLSASADGSRLAFSHSGNIYTMVPGNEPQLLTVNIVSDDYDADHVRRKISDDAENMTVNPDGEEVAFTVRGDIYVTSTKYTTTRRITDTPGQERSISFSPDGRTLVYDSERDGRWQLFTASIDDDADKGFAYASTITETPLYSCDGAAQQPAFSPDGTKVAFLENRTALRVIDVDTKAVNTALDGKFNYSYADGDISFAWSPDSKWLLIDYIGTGGWNNKDIALVAADGSTVVDLTESGYEDSNAKWAMDGKALTYQTGRFGMRSHGSWGNQDDVVFMALDGDAWDTFNRSAEEAELAEEAEAAAESDEEKADKPKKKKDKKKPAADEAAFDLPNRRYRMKRLTGISVSMYDHYLAPKGDKLYYLAAAPEGNFKLYCTNLHDDETSVLAEGVTGELLPDKDGSNLFVNTAAGIRKVSLADGEVSPIEFEALYDRHPSAERAYIFDHVHAQVKDKFYDPDLHGVEWDSLAQYYRTFLPAINNNQDFAILLSELLGELNASHTGATAYLPRTTLLTPSLGCYFDPEYQGDGLKVQAILPAGPLSLMSVGIVPGDIIMSIDGRDIAAGADYFELLDGKSGHKTRLGVLKADGSTVYTYVKPISNQSHLLYRAWVERNQAIVDSLSDGRIAYVHIEGMDSPSFRTVFDELLGRFRDREAVIVDTRFNGGGWLHHDVARLLDGRQTATFAPRGQQIGIDPFDQWTKPSVMLVNEANYSDAYGTPYTYQTLGVGDIVGAPVPGTMTAVWWETQIDPTIVFGIPEVTVLNMQGQALENKQLQPEIEVYNTPAESTSGNDLQLAAAVNRLLEQLSTKSE